MKKCFLFALLCGICINNFGQVTLQAGSATYSLPILNWRDQKSRLNDNVTLDYYSGNGLKVNEVASNVGQGWNLMAGGMITRIQIGEPDDQVPSDGAYDNIDKYPAGYLYNPMDPSIGCPKELVNFPIFDHPNQIYKQHNVLSADREQDYFSFQFNGRSGLFALNKGSENSGFLLGDSKLRIWFETNLSIQTQQFSRTSITAFHIQDENGLIYTFSQIGKAKVLRIHPCGYAGSIPYKTPQPVYNDKTAYSEFSFDELPLSALPYVINTWYLTEIRDPLTNRAVVFNYTIRTIYSSDGDDMRYSFSAEFNAEYVVTTHKQSIVQSAVVSSIVYPDGYKVTLNYDYDHPRVDLAGDYPMKSVDIAYNNRPSARYLLNTTYFILNNLGIPSEADRSKARLCLTSVVKLGVDLKENEPPYVFDYYMGSSTPGDFVPPPFYYFKDIWGYYDGGNANQQMNSQTSDPIPFLNKDVKDLNFWQIRALCFMKDMGARAPLADYSTVHPGYAKNGLLRSISFPMGGKLLYNYEQNEGVLSSFGSAHPVPVGGVHVSSVVKTDGGYSNGEGHEMVTSYKYTDNSGSGSSQWGLETPLNYAGSTYFFSPGGQHHTVFNGCKYDYTYAGILSREESRDVAAENKPAVAIVFQVIQFASYAFDIYMLISAQNPAGIIMDAIFIIVNLITECSEDYSQDGGSASSTNYNIYSRNPFPVQFSRIEVTEGPPGTAARGKTVYEFTSKDDYALWDDPYDLNVSYPNSIFAMRQRAAAWAYGLPKKVTVYDAEQRIVRETTSVYDYSNAKRMASSQVSCNCLVQHSISMNSPDWMNLPNGQNIHYSTQPVTYSEPPFYDIKTGLKVDQYPLYTGRVELTYIYDKTYKNGDPTRSLETVTHYVYDPDSYMVRRIETTESNGDMDVKEMYYTADYSTTGILETLKDNHILSLPVATYTSIIKNNTSEKLYTGATLVQFVTLSNGDIRPSNTLTGRSLQPITGFTFDPSDPYNYPNLVATRKMGYDATGNLVKISDESGRTMANITDCGDKYIVANVTNDDPDIDPVAYSSFETDKTYGLSVDFPLYNTNISVTGGRSFVLNNKIPGTVNAVYCDIANSKPYILSFWMYGFSNLHLPTNFILTRTGPTYNGFTYYEYSVPAGSTGFRLFGSGTIDELRYYPAMSRMATATYDPLVGRTSDCDENNRIKYYEYDALSRLRFIKDERKNILKMYEYNVKQGGTVTPATDIPYSGQLYAKLVTENTLNAGGGDVIGDVVLYFYSDAACTNPVYAKDVTVYVKINDLCSQGSYYDAFNRLVNGSRIVLAQGIYLTDVTTTYDESGNEHDDVCNISYVLDLGAYIIK